MTQTEARTRVRNLLNQTDSTNTQYDNSDFIDHALNEGRRMFAMVLDEKHLIRLRTRASLSVTSGIGAYPSDFLRTVRDPYVTVDGGDFAKRIDEDERWRLRLISKGPYGLPSDTLNNWYYYEDDGGVNVLPTSTATTINYDYIKIPSDLDGNEDYELPDSVNDAVVDYAFQKCMGTTRGNRDLAIYLAKERNLKIASYNNAYTNAE